MYFVQSVVASIMRRSVTSGVYRFTAAYNIGVENPPSPNESGGRQRRRAAYVTEISGLLLVAFLLLVLTVIRYWHAIRWSVR
jgi:hypothetical protein